MPAAAMDPPKLPLADLQPTRWQCAPPAEQCSTGELVATATNQVIEGEGGSWGVWGVGEKMGWFLIKV